MSEHLDEATITRAITEMFGGVDVVESSGNSFFFYDRGPDLPPDHRFPFATLVTTDEYDQFSELNRPSVYRLNVGVSGETFRRLFGAQASASDANASTDGASCTDAAAESSHDFAALDRVMPHPVYGQLHWVCVLSPSAETFETVRPLLAEAYALAARRYASQHPAPPPPDSATP